MTFSEKPIELDACEEAREWVEDKPLTEAWETCENIEWMLWLSRKAGIDNRKIVLCGARFAETVLDKMTDECSRNAVAVALRYGSGEEVSKEELETARNTASSKANSPAANSAYYAAYAAAKSAYYAAFKPNSYATKSAAAAKSAAIAAKSAAIAASKANMAAIVREIITAEEITKGLGL